MKIRYSIILCALGVAFVAVSLWVFLSRGRSRKALKTKFKLGGLILTVSSMIACSEGTGPMQVSCYDVAAPEYVLFSTPGEWSKVKAGDEIEIIISDSGCTSFHYKIFVKQENDAFQQGILGDEEGTYKVKLAETDFKGQVNIVVYGTRNEAEVLLGGRSFVIE